MICKYFDYDCFEMERAGIIACFMYESTGGKCPFMDCMECTVKGNRRDIKIFLDDVSKDNPFLKHVKNMGSYED